MISLDEGRQSHSKRLTYVLNLQVPRSTVTRLMKRVGLKYVDDTMIQIISCYAILVVTRCEFSFSLGPNS